MAKEKRLIWDEDAKQHLIALAVGHHSETLHIDMILNAILHHAPTVDAVPVVHGRWEIITDDYDCEMMCCSVCRSEFYDGDNDTVDCLHNYCPNCGAKMDGDGIGIQ